MRDLEMAAVRLASRFGPFPYRDWQIHQTGFYAHPDWWKIQWTCSHKDYDGEGDNRCFTYADLEECQFEIYCWYEENC